MIFSSVLSGNAGSFGIVTKYTYKAIMDSDHLNSYGIAQNRIYDFEVFCDLMGEV